MKLSLLPALALVLRVHLPSDLLDLALGSRLSGCVLGLRSRVDTNKQQGQF